jgi:hypothetical protein
VSVCSFQFYPEEESIIEQVSKCQKANAKSIAKAIIKITLFSVLFGFSEMISIPTPSSERQGLENVSMFSMISSSIMIMLALYVFSQIPRGLWRMFGLILAGAIVMIKFDGMNGVIELATPH